ncbi:gastrula zinc finger protein XlCGF26.1-like [Cyprinus carpio]|uniref:Gastrula zinc finger protein XlCGF26.1-like n=1 Tax=Cyprinus carpio TaxID=7962 RepID=A0A9R0ANM5_CYPCA|nr:gastrula zinc finger protein XlCGF26.1-like [Cyprinus carpio]
MRDPEPCRIKHTEEQTDLMEEKKHNVKTLSQTESISLLKRRGKKGFTCTQCGKSFTYKQSLKRHMNIHTGEKPYTCDQCGKSFTQSSNLKMHMKLHTEEKLHECDQCGKTFSWASSWINHLKVHSDEKTTIHVLSVGKSFFFNNCRV